MRPVKLLNCLMNNINSITDMKRIQIILLFLGIALTVHINAQQMAEQPHHSFHSTSVMPQSGSQLPMSAQTGVQMSWSSPSANSLNRPIRRSDDGFEPDPDPQNPADPFPDPIGDATIPLALLALAFAFAKWIARKTKPLR